jgi:hypothetical protein
MKHFLFTFLMIALVCMAAETGLTASGSAGIDPGEISMVTDDTAMHLTAIGHTPYVPSINGNIIFTLIAVNTGGVATPIWVELYPVIGD